MIAIDTNVLVRLLVADDPAQARRARLLVEKSQVLVTASVLLEAEWVLRSAYRFQAGAIARAFRALLGLPNVTPDSPAALEQALAAYEGGTDFADALHIASAASAAAFYTFDRKLVAMAKETRPAVRLVPG